VVEKRHLSKNEQTEINFDERSTAHLGPLSDVPRWGTPWLRSKGIQGNKPLNAQAVWSALADLGRKAVFLGDLVDRGR
jgi:hypothetical protein